MYGPDVRILRLGGRVYGTGYAISGTIGQVLQLCIEKPLKGKLVLADSAPIIPMLYGGDASRGCMTAHLAAELSHEAYDINAPSTSTLYQVTLVKVPTEAGPLQARVDPTRHHLQADFGYAVV